MSGSIIKKKNSYGTEVEVLGETFEPGMPTEKGLWRNKLIDRKAMLKYLEHGERYWYSNDWFGSEKRKYMA